MTKAKAQKASEQVEIDVPEGSTVAMVRNEEQYPPEKYGPGSADVHVDEVENWSKHGWTLAPAKGEAPSAD